MSKPEIKLRHYPDKELGFVAYTYIEGKEKNLILASGIETTEEQALEWLDTTAKLQAVHPALSAPDRARRNGLSEEKP